MFLFDEIQRWPAGLLDRLTAWDLIEELGPTDMVACDSCPDNHPINVDICEYPTGMIGMGKCPECGRIQIPLNRLRQWRLNSIGVASVLARAIDASGSVIEDVPGRVVLVGTVQYQMETREVFLAVGLARKDAPAVLASSQRLRESKAPFVLSAGVMPSSKIWPGGMDPAVIVLAEHAVLGPVGLTLDLEPLFGLGSVPHPDAESPVWITVTEAAELLMKDLPFLVSQLGKAKARVSRAASGGKFKTNGEKGQARRIDAGSLAQWRLEQRDADLDEPEIVTRGTRYGKMAAGAPARRNID